MDALAGTPLPTASAKEVDTLYQWVVFLHVLGVFGFLLAHGVSVFVAFRVQQQKDIQAIRALLGLSASAVMMSLLSLLVLLLGGVVAGFMGHWWSHGWIWVALGVFVLVWMSMSIFTGPAFRRARIAAGFTGPRTFDESVVSEKLPEALAELRPWLPMAIGSVGLLVILWLMMLKPF
jgi:uncharacterized membrane protein